MNLITKTVFNHVQFCRHDDKLQSKNCELNVNTHGMDVP